MQIEGSPSTSTEESAGGEAASQTEPTEGQIEEATSQERTPDEIEAIWRNRIAGKDRAHAAETSTLRQQLEEANRRAAAAEARKAQEAAAEMSEAEQWKARAEEAERRAAEIERQRVLDVRTAKYGAAAEALDADVLAAMDEAKLAALNARLTGDEAPAPPLIDPNSPRRQSASPAPSPREKSVEELEADLRKFEPEFEGRLR